jgi:Domain of unknown function (DUF4136)
MSRNPDRRHLPTQCRCVLAIAAAIALTACSHNIEVRTIAAPNATFAGRSTFRILPTPIHRGAALAANDPMLVNSITYHAIRDEIQRAFAARGYVYSPGSADLDIAYYATAEPVLDLRTFDYGYNWRGFPRQYVDVVQYTQGTVIIDVIDPVTHGLLWRGQAQAAVDTDPDKFASELRKAVDAIVAKFPARS